MDREALKIGAGDNVLVITSAGCNALSYALDGPARVFAVDINPQQNALLELKLAGIKTLSFENFFQLFGVGRHSGAKEVYRQQLRRHLSEKSQAFWDRRITMFAGKQPFYFRGATGVFLRLFNAAVNRRAGMRSAVNDLLEAADVDEQWRIYTQRIQPGLWRGLLPMLLRSAPARWLTMIPAGQLQQTRQQSPETDLAALFRERIERVIRKLPLRDNYFWRVYLTGAFTKECCPDYLRPGNFTRLKEGLADCIQVHTGSVEAFLQSHATSIDCFALLDHFDWHSTTTRESLQLEINAICQHAAPGARLVWRSLGDNRAAVDETVALNPTERGPLQYEVDAQQQLLAQERTGVYANLYIATLQ